ncbi:hypothetical protein Goari_020349, partial [Gossypium aridum]|nr:hypothetical protein [Gossypium aridum]
IIYLQAIVPEPVISLRAASEDCTLSTGYHIPSGTRLMVNAWKIQCDDFLHSLKVGKPSKLADVDITESTGLTNLKATPLQVLITLRLHSKLYELQEWVKIGGKNQPLQGSCIAFLVPMMQT